ncbi:glutaminase A [Ramlibacter sp. PS3R-8]|uniref:glutaminase A n=1 Tax=Ramlibacter sp. PS3R-8 TaxID=3133437 RepID=UPI00309D0517
MTDRDPKQYLQHLLERFRPERGGTPACTPETTGMARNAFAIAIATVDGEVYSAGNADDAFTLQSMSKPFIYGLALDLFGREAVHARVNVEPTGEAFNSITELEEDHLPYNPMINSGAITMSAMLHHADPDHAREWMMAMFGRYLGREPELHPKLDLDVRPHRNLAIGHLLRHFDVIGDDIEGALELYGRQCGLAVSTRDLAMMAATLAGGGVHPRTRARALQRKHVRDVLTLMFTCGMYDASGHWAYTVGLPAKSGVSGGILAVVPGRMGLAVYSPRLDRHGNSVRGVEVFKAMSADGNLSLFAVPGEDGVPPSPEAARKKAAAE